MSDLFESLREDVENPHSPLPAAQVRRRGDRLARRRTLTQVAGTAVLVTAIALGGAALLRDTGADDGLTATGPGVHPNAGRFKQVVPKDFRLDLGLPRGEKVEGPQREASFLPDQQLCQDTHPSTSGDVDRLTVTSTGPGLFVGRDLAVYPNSRYATTHARELVSGFAACPRFTLDGGATAVVTSVRVTPRDELGEQSWTVSRGYESAGRPTTGREVWVISQTGNALLVTRTSDERQGLSLSRQGARERAALTPLVDSMCTFSVQGCGHQTPLAAQGYGDLRMGMSVAEVAAGATATVGPDDGGACRTLTYPESPPGKVDGFVSKKHGVALLFAPEGGRTSEWLREGSTAAAVTAIHPDAEETPNGVGITAPAERGYRWYFALDGPRVEQISLQLDTQDCVS